MSADSQQPLISIIITILNGEKTISQCLDSINNQTFVDYEVVLVDGGSTDKTIDLINESSIVSKRVQVIPGVGLYAGLNAGIRMATGRWLYFIGCDDQLYESTTLQKVTDIITVSQPSVQIFVGNVACVKQKNLLRARFGSPYWMRYQVHHQGMFYARSIFANNLYNETMRIASDYEFNLKLALNKVPHQAMDLIICNFGGDGISENQIKRGFREMQLVHKRVFHGVGLRWAMFSYWLQQTIIIIRKRLNLVNLKVRLKRWLRIDMLPR
ncbi:glycosyltransferase [Fibrella forsythiae]|uniref:Glycosyltransferase n=1 Tax=Fibrella forsythiae TaxID=2817061 RepID=A0ABS3JK32_9BACT|nr:glycosyltransferase [Fibrella forsythiae]MBO0949262.1 glycosyltransferase [Fibrella forsythiae]